MSQALNILERKNINIIDYLKRKDKTVINEIMIALAQEGELKDGELESFSYVFDILEEEYKNLDYSDISLTKLENRKNAINKSRLDFFLAVYSKFISSYGAAAIASVSASYGIGGLTYLAIIPTFLTPIVAKKINYGEYVNEKQYGTERIVKDYLKKTNLGFGYISYGDTFNRMDAYRRKIAYFKDTIAKRIDLKYDDDRKSLKGLKLFLAKIGHEIIDVLTVVRGGSGINKNLRNAEKELNSLMGGTKNVKAAYEKISDEMYNEYLSKNIEEYLVFLVNERIELKNKEKELKRNFKVKYFEETNSEFFDITLKIKENKRNIEKISKLKNLNYLTSEKDAVYYSGVSNFAELVFDEIKRANGDEDSFSNHYILSLVGKNYQKKLILQKKKALLRIESKKLAKDLNIDPESNKDLLVFQKCLSVVMAGTDFVDIKYRVKSILESNIKNESDLQFSLFKYSEFVDRFNEEFKTFNSSKISTPVDLDNCFESKIKDLIKKHQHSKIRDKKRINKNN